ncbi:hypothetical protein FB384_004439 [Prauserella sediminis]|uniref:Uncharacterized protein n=1 Tax=Prauserella sediminis TaxID=577680 RepID=A0A839XNR5_9PSEU|nr:hypothetical protein [Prauserella sediminis]MBB3665482.1 hypothetical protein [Prauserella sediminis]
MLTLDPGRVHEWPTSSREELLTVPRATLEQAQRAALLKRFDSLRHDVEALAKLADRQGVDNLEGDPFDSVVPLLFDHRVYKSYPLSLIEKRDFGRLTSWLNRLTTHKLTDIPLDDLQSVDAWLDRLDEQGMIIGHSTGTTGKLSFIPRSTAEWPAWKAAHFASMTAATGVDPREVAIPSFSSGYRSGHQMMTKMNRLFAEEQAGGDSARHILHDYRLSSDLLSLAGRLQAAEEAGELDQLQIDPRILEERRELIEAARNRDQSMQEWFAGLVDRFRGERVRIGGTTADLVRLAVAGRDAGVHCEFAADSLVMAGGGMKGYKDAPADWETLLKEFYGVPRILSMYGMSECMGTAPLCEAGYFHFFPYTIPIVLDEDATPLPRTGVQTGRLGLYDLLAETYWGGFISGDKITAHWDEDCPCGWTTPRIERQIVRFSELEGGDDKITCAGTQKAYTDFMDYVSGT